MKRQLLLYFSLGFKFIPGHFSGYDKSQAFAKDYSWTGTACGSCILISSYSPKEVKAEELKRIHLKQFWLFWICPERAITLKEKRNPWTPWLKFSPCQRSSRHGNAYSGKLPSKKPRLGGYLQNTEIVPATYNRSIHEWQCI